MPKLKYTHNNLKYEFSTWACPKIQSHTPLLKFLISFEIAYAPIIERRFGDCFFVQLYSLLYIGNLISLIVSTTVSMTCDCLLLQMWMNVTVTHVLMVVLAKMVFSNTHVIVLMVILGFTVKQVCIKRAKYK